MVDSASFNIPDSATFGDTGSKITVAPAQASQPEQTVRPWVAFQERRDQALATLRSPPGAPEDAQLCWGKAPPDLTAQQPAGPTISFKDDKNDNKQPNTPNAVTWTEVERQNKKVKVASEDDPDVFVFVNVAQKSLIRVHDAAKIGAPYIIMNWCTDPKKGGGP